MKSFKQKKLLYSVGEVSQMFDVNASLLRHWEKKISMLCPLKSEKGTRQYREEDIETIRKVQRLVEEEGLTLTGVNQRLLNHPEDAAREDMIIQRLQVIRSELLAMKAEVEETETQLTIRTEPPPAPSKRV